MKIKASPGRGHTAAELNEHCRSLRLTATTTTEALLLAMLHARLQQDSGLGLFAHLLETEKSRRKTRKLISHKKESPPRGKRAHRKPQGVGGLDG